MLVACCLSWDQLDGLLPWMELLGFSWQEGTYGWKPQVRDGKRKGELDFCIIVVCGGKNK